MTTVHVHRPAPVVRAQFAADGEPLVLATPPQLTDQHSATANLGMIVMPLLSGSGSLLITLTNQNRPLFAAAGLVFMVVSVGLGILLFFGTRSSSRRRQRQDRERYLDYLELVRRAARDAAGLQNNSAALRHPAPDELVDLCRLPARRWERRPSDPDFLALRVGLGTVPLARDLRVAVDRSNPLISYDPVCLSAAENLVHRYAALGDQPISVPLAGIGHLSVVGEPDRIRAIGRGLVAQLAALHAPDDVRVAVIRAGPLAPLWDWVKWLPHTENGLARTGSGAAHDRDEADLLVASTLPDLLDRLAPDLDARRGEEQRRQNRSAPGRCRLVIVVDGEFQLAPPYLETGPTGSLAELGVHVIHLVAHRREEAERVDLRITLGSDPEPDACAVISADRDGAAEVLVGKLDQIETVWATALARTLSPLRMTDDDDSDALLSTVGLRELLGVPDVADLDPSRTWRPGTAQDFLRVAVGVGASGQLVHLDLKESARGGMGPHGLVIGATGSGKSEMLRTMVTSLVISHPPERLSLLLVDFKGGATFAGLAPLPHVAGLVTNLADDPGLVQRFRDALYGELTRRQRLLADAGNLPNLQAYADLAGQFPTAGVAEPLPHLLVIIDEFTELLTARPDFAELFLAVGRIGRSIGVHLLLATQRLDAGRIRGLDSHLSYRIGLRTFSEAESREALGVPDAYHLPSEPGSGYLKVDTTVFERFKAALVSTPHRRQTGPAAVLPRIGTFSATPAVDRVMPAPAHDRGFAGAASRQEAGANAAVPTVLDVAVRRLAAAGSARVRQIWIEPLPPALPLDAVPDERTEGHSSRSEGDVSAILGLRDLPAEQRQIPLTWDFTGPQGNLLVLGCSLSGKSILLRTLMCSLALRYEPGVVAFYALDFGGGSLAALQALPHVAGVSTRSDPERVRRTVADVVGMLDIREGLVMRHGRAGPEGLRRLRRAGPAGSDVARAEAPGDVFLVVDGWAALREAEPELEDQVMTIANRGPSLGVHTVVAASAISQVRMRLAAALPGRIELRLTDGFDSGIDRRRADSLPVDVPGRALLPGADFGQIALPRIDGRSSTDDLARGTEDLVEQVRRRWPGPGISPVRVLPARLELRALRATVEPSRRGRDAVAVGLSERDLAPVAVDLFGSDPHLQVYGEAQSGKSTFVRTLLAQLVHARMPAELGIVLIDYRRAHLDLVPPDYLLGHCSSAAAARAALADLAAGLAQRLPGPAVTREQLRARSWWSGREVVVVADDYERVAAAAGNPIAALSEFLAQGRDVGLHLVTARRTGGAARAMFEPVTQALNDLGGPGLLFSGDRTEGRLVAGVASLPLPPGRALLARRGRPAEQVQIAWTDPDPRGASPPAPPFQPRPGIGGL